MRPRLPRLGRACLYFGALSFVLVLLAVMTGLRAVLLSAPLLLACAAPCMAGPPERASGEMVFDEVADGLRRYRSEKDETKRVEWLRQLAPTRAPPGRRGSRGTRFMTWSRKG